MQRLEREKREVGGEDGSDVCGGRLCRVGLHVRGEGDCLRRVAVRDVQVASAGEWFRGYRGRGGSGRGTPQNSTGAKPSRTNERA